MHELAVMGRVVAAPEREVEPARVRCLRLQIGELCGALPETIRFCFAICTRGTRLEAARLEMDEARGRGRCRRCGGDAHSETHVDPCRCGSGEIDVLGGRELRIQTVEVQ